MAIIKIIPMPGPKGDAGSGSGLSSTVPFTLNDTNGNALLTISETGTGTTRIETPQDDLSLRSAADITLFPGSDGPGKVYIGWGDAEYTPNATNEVATIGYVQNAVGTNKVKYVDWGYPTQNAVAIQNATNGQAISVKSSQSAALRWHIRDGGRSVAGWSIEANSIIQQTGENGVGPYQVQFAISELDFVPPTGYHYGVTGSSIGNWDGSYICTASTTTTITLEYPGPNLPGANEEFTGGSIYPPSIYNQVEANDSGVWVKNANWSEPGGAVNSWHFGTDGVLSGPLMGQVVVSGIAGAGQDYPLSLTSNDKVLLSGANGEFIEDATIPGNQIARVSDLINLQPPVAVRWSPTFSATGLTFTGVDATYPTYNSYYVKYGQMVTFWIEVDLSTVTNFGTGQYMLELPTAPFVGTMNHFSGWCLVDPDVNPDNAGHAVLNIDHLAGSQTLDMHYLKQSGGANSPIMEAMFKQGSPVTLTTSSKIYVNGTYISAS